MCRSWCQISPTNTAEPTNANQNGAVTPKCCASAPPSAAPTTSPPNTPTRLTLPTRPWSSVGTARCRTVIDVVPHTNACAPKTKKIPIATQGVVVSARHRWVRVSMTRPMRMRFARVTCLVSQPYPSTPARPPSATTVVISPYPTAPRPRCSRA